MPPDQGSIISNLITGLLIIENLTIAEQKAYVFKCKIRIQNNIHINNMSYFKNKTVE